MACPVCSLDHPPPCRAAGRPTVLAAIARGDAAVIAATIALARGEAVGPQAPRRPRTAEDREKARRLLAAHVCPYAEPFEGRACSQWCGLIEGQRHLVKLAVDCVACGMTHA